MRSVVLWVLTAAAATVALLGPATAPAEAVNVVTCQLAGVVQFSPGVMLVGGAPGYDLGPSLAANTNCTHTNGTAVSGPMTSQLESAGSYQNIVCGTGEMRPDTAFGPTTLDMGSTRVMSSVSYTIQLRNWTGQIEITAVNGTPEQAPGNGWVVLRPHEGSCLSPTGVTSADIVGVFTAVW